LVRAERARQDHGLPRPHRGRRALVERLLPFDVVRVMRERTPLPHAVIESLPRLKMIASTGTHNRSIDADAACERGVVVTSATSPSQPSS
jgi:phosphoglycerate dehydrogenase-like enzyme